MRIAVRVFALLVLVAFTGLSSAWMTLSVRVDVTGSPVAAVAAINAEIAARGGQLVTSPSHTQWYVLDEANLSVTATGPAVIVEATRLRGPGCSDQDLESSRTAMFVTIEEIVHAATRKSGLPMRCHIQPPSDPSPPR